MTAEKKIEMIKWMCGYAEGFEYQKKEAQYMEHIQYPGGTCSLNWLIDDPIVYPLLLTRAIEGVNKGGYFGDTQWEVRTYRWGIEVLNYNGVPFVKAKFRFEEKSNSYLTNTAKLSALEYIYDKEAQS